jgi:2-oxoglutarate/2-oxoacid ferredoxin oxidoreductase subunit alpha
MGVKNERKAEVVICFAGDSGDGIQLTGGQFTETSSLHGNDFATFPDFPAEIRAPKGTLAGVSGFQLKFGSVEIFTPGDRYDVLVAMNAAALKTHLGNLKKAGIIIANTNGFDKKNLKLAEYIDGENPLEDNSLEDFLVHQIDISKLTRNALKDSGLDIKEIDRSKNMFVLGYLYWMYNRKLDGTQEFIQQKFKSKPGLMQANLTALKTGYYFADTAEAFTSRFEVEPAPLEKGNYRNIIGNHGLALGLIAAAEKSNLTLFYGSYPITPASDILHFLSAHKNFGIKTFQAEDEIAAITSAIGASFGGALGVTASSGPGMALKSESLGLAIMLELPLVICNIQRGGPSTGLPTKTEQADLFQAIYGRNSEAPLPVIAAYSPTSAFGAAYEACKIALEHMTPVILLSDGYIANGSEPWKFPASKDLPIIGVNQVGKIENENSFLPYSRNKDLVRPWAVPGTKGLEHRIGGLEKSQPEGNVSYDPENHEEMVRLRASKIEKIAEKIGSQKLESGEENWDCLILGWGSTYGAIQSAVRELRKEGKKVSHAHLRYLNPLPKNLEELLQGFERVVIPELNSGQLSSLIRDKYLIDAKKISKIKGMPFQVDELIAEIKKYL